MVGELHKLSKKELAMPTGIERTKKKSKQRREAVAGEERGTCSEDGSKTPKLNEFGAFVFESPTKKR